VPSAPASRLAAAAETPLERPWRDPDGSTAEALTSALRADRGAHLRRFRSQQGRSGVAWRCDTAGFARPTRPARPLLRGVEATASSDAWNEIRLTGSTTSCVPAGAVERVFHCSTCVQRDVHTRTGVVCGALKCGTPFSRSEEW